MARTAQLRDINRLVNLHCSSEETAEHLLFDCPAIARERYAIFGSLDRGGEFSQEDLIGCFRRFVELLKL
ncbi:hypothetical protein J6590_044630 [Homalodisca vitripennis]|nr:hypothetical protein J6590_044630 [Homalodisca vitripennis]